jgi:hypothetical protein
MIPRRPDPPEQPRPDLPQTRERRAFVRYPRRFEMLWQLLGLSPRDRTQAAVCDVSATGLGLVCDTPLPVDALVVLRLPSATTGWSSHLVRVKRCTEQPDGTFQVGCRFTKPLSASQLQELLG